MANTMRHKYGETNPVTLPVDSATDIEIGDLVLLDTEDAKPASSIRIIGDWSTDRVAFAQEQFHDSFVGVAMQRSRVGDTQAIRIATSGIFAFDAAGSIFDFGDRVGVAQDGGLALEDQKVVGVAQNVPQRAVGRVAKRWASDDTKVLVEIYSTIMRDGPRNTATAPAETNGETRRCMYAISFDASGDGLDNLQIGILPEPLFRTLAKAKKYADEMAGPKNYGVMPVDGLPESVRDELLMSM